MTVVCGDSHTSTHGAFGALAHRHRHQRGRARAGHADAAGEEGEEHAGQGRRHAAAAAARAKDIVLAIIGTIGTAGGTGYTIEFAGSAIRALSMEGRMTVCNMAIEAGARAGLVAVDDTTIDYVRGPAVRADRRASGTQAVAYWRTLQSATPGAHFDTRGRARRRADPAAGHLGHVARDGACRSTAACPIPTRRRTPSKRDAIERALTYMGLEPNKPIDRHPHRQGLHRLVHQLPHRGPARGRGGGAAARQQVAPQRQARDGGAGLGPGEGSRPSAKACDAGLQGRRLRVARAGLLDVPGDERRPARARRALRLDQQPQLRRPPGRRRPHPPGQPGDGRGGRDRTATSSTCADSPEERHMEAIHRPHRASSRRWTARTSTPTRSSPSSS